MVFYSKLGTKKLEHSVEGEVAVAIGHGHGELEIKLNGEHEGKRFSAIGNTRIDAGEWVRLWSRNSFNEASDGNYYFDALEIINPKTREVKHKQIYTKDVVHSSAIFL